MSVCSLYHRNSQFSSTSVIPLNGTLKVANNAFSQVLSPLIATLTFAPPSVSDSLECVQELVSEVPLYCSVLKDQLGIAISPQKLKRLFFNTAVVFQLAFSNRSLSRYLLSNFWEISTIISRIENGESVLTDAAECEQTLMKDQNAVSLPFDNRQDLNTSMMEKLRVKQFCNHCHKSKISVALSFLMASQHFICSDCLTNSESTRVIELTDESNGNDANSNVGESKSVAAESSEMDSPNSVHGTVGIGGIGGIGGTGDIVGINGIDGMKAVVGDKVHVTAPTVSKSQHRSGVAVTSETHQRVCLISAVQPQLHSQQQSLQQSQQLRNQLQQPHSQSDIVQCDEITLLPTATQCQQCRAIFPVSSTTTMIVKLCHACQVKQQQTRVSYAQGDMPALNKLLRQVLSQRGDTNLGLCGRQWRKDVGKPRVEIRLALVGGGGGCVRVMNL